MVMRFAVLALVLGVTQPLHAQVATRDGVHLRLGGRVQPQINTTSADAEPVQQMLFRRARITLDASWGWLSARIEPDVGGGELNIKDAWVAYAFAPSLRARFGQFKRPFDLFELTSSTQIMVVERAGGIRGAGVCGGVGGVCSLSRFTERLAYADRDVGIELSGTAGALGWTAAMTNGAGANVADENSAKSFTGRAAVTLGAGTVLGANVAAHDYPHPTGGSDEYAIAFGGDLELGRFEDGLHVQAGFVTGDNWLIPVGTADAATFMTAQAIVAYSLPMRGERLRGITPLARLSWGDPDTDTDDDHGILITPGLDLNFGNRNKLAFNVDIWRPATGPNAYSVKVQQFFSF